ncbi:MAG: filamentous hemagglutinin N-terminal domain-containing protein [Alphaproteobacteria bacterium]|nr:filamentous hemagglutinin N-terminal domain-containing protein [Alphaproteobacteria bacterium]
MPSKVAFGRLLVLLLAVLPRLAIAQHISIDGRFSPAQTLAGPNYSITANLGKQVGSNLFQSFGIFGLSTGESATFSGPATVSNVIGRVTGGSPSSINGRINSNIVGANLYLINSGGIVFGPNATVNVSGSLYASTADYLKMTDGARFQSTNPDGSTLSAAPPAAFGFLNAAPAAITVNGSTLGPVPGTLGLVGGPVSISRGTLRAPAGTIHVTGIAGTGEVPVDPRNSSALTVTNFAPVNITTGSLLTASNMGTPGSGGSVFIRSGALTVDASTIAASNSGAGPGGQLVLEGGSQVTLSAGSSVQASANSSNSGQPGLSIHAGAVTIDASTIAANNAGSLPGSQLVLRGDQGVTLSNKSVVQALVLSNGSGPALTIDTAPGGYIRVDTGSMAIIGTDGPGNGGLFNVQTGQLIISNGASFTSRSGITGLALAKGNGSPIAISANGVLLDGGATLNTATGIFSTTSSIAANAGAGGAIAIAAGQLTIQNGANVLAQSSGPGIGGAVSAAIAGDLTITSAAQLASVAKGAGNAGDVSVNASGAIAIDIGATPSLLDGIGSLTQGGGNAGNVTVMSGALTLTHNGLVSSLTAGSGNSRTVSINVSGTLSIDGSAGNQGVPTGILGDSYASGHGGNVTVTAGRLTISGGACGIGGGACPGLISSDALYSGHGGDIAISANNVSIGGSGQISSSSFVKGDSGNVSVNVAQSLTIDGAMTPGVATGIFSQANRGSTGNAGSVSVNAGSLSILDSGTISTGTFGPGQGGKLSVTVGGGLTIDGVMTPGLPTGIFSQANQGSTGNAGPITVSADGISLANQGQISSQTFGPGSAGQVNVMAGGLSLASNGGIVSAAEPGSSGNGGKIAVTVAGQLSIDAALGNPSLLTGISTTSEGSGDAGSIAVTAGTLSITHNGEISSDTFATGKGGSVSIMANGPLTIDGSGTNPDIVATGIVTNSEASSSGNAGTVSVTASALTLINGGVISSALRPFMNLPASTGNAGSVTVNVDGLASISGSSSRIGTETTPGSIGNAGSVIVSAAQIALTNGGEIVSTTAGTGAGGMVQVTTPGALTLDSMGNSNTAIAASATGPQSGAGGAVTVQAGSLTIEGGAQIASSTAGHGKGGNVDVVVASDIILPDRGPQITARSTGSGDAGSITVLAVRLLMNNGATISTEAETSTANGGNVSLSVRDFLYLVGSEITTSVKGETGNGGNITIDPDFAVLDHSSIVAQAIEGHGGNITITAGTFIPSTDSVVSASSQLGVSGTVVINGPRVDLNGTLVVLSSELRSAVALTREACAARANRFQSSLVEGGRGGLPQDPEATVPALYIAGRDLARPGRAAANQPATALQTTVHLTLRCGEE